MSKQTRRTKALKALFPVSDMYQLVAARALGATVYTRWIRLAADGTKLQPGQVGTAKGVYHDPGFMPKDAYVVTYPKKTAREALEAARTAMEHGYNGTTLAMSARNGWSV